MLSKDRSEARVRQTPSAHDSPPLSRTVAGEGGEVHAQTSALSRRPELREVLAGLAGFGPGNRPRPRLAKRRPIYSGTTIRCLILESASGASKALHADVKGAERRNSPKDACRNKMQLGGSGIKPALGKIDDIGKSYFNLRFFKSPPHPRAGSTLRKLFDVHCACSQSSEINC
jgi:hypothetical protein